MTRVSYFLCLILLATTASAAAPIDYVRDVYPILDTYCVGCHTEGDPEGGLVLAEYALMMNGGDSGPAITPGVPDSSRLLMMSSGKLEPVMPPDGEEGPNEEELAILAAWIEQGAVGPGGDMPLKVLRTPKIETGLGVDAPLTAIASHGNYVAVAKFGVVEIRESGVDGSVLHTFGDFPGKINSLQFVGGDSQQLLVATGLTGAYGQATLINWSTLQRVDLQAHNDTLYAAAISPDGNTIATAGYDKTIRLWDAETGENTANLLGHNGAVFDLAFSPDSQVLVSASADETAKVWHVASAKRLDTLSQPEGEVYAVDVTADGQHVVAASADNRVRVWRLLSTDTPAINPLVATRFVDESSLVAMAQTTDGAAFVFVSETGNVKVVRSSDWNIAAALDPVEFAASDLSVSPDGQVALIALMNGEVVSRELPNLDRVPSVDNADDPLPSLWMDLDTPKAFAEADLAGNGNHIRRGAVVEGVVNEVGQVDRYHWSVKRGEMWSLKADSVTDSMIDPLIWIEDENGQPVVRTRLQAIRDSYFTFRGKNSLQSNDFRMFAWQEMNLDDYLYAAGEVTKLWMHPRGPDSGFNVYPGTGNRWTYFGTTQSVHALGEPAYIVRPLAAGQEPLANGLPVLTIDYRNDDDPMRNAGSNSRLVFKAPRDGNFTVAITDTRAEGGSDYRYKLTLDAAKPDFQPSVKASQTKLFVKAGREFEVRVKRFDEFGGPVTFEVNNLPPGVRTTSPITIEAGQASAEGVIWIQDAEGLPESFEPTVVAIANINGKRVERDAGTLGKFTRSESPPKLRPTIISMNDGNLSSDQAGWTLSVPRGETVTARVQLNRAKGFDDEVSLGKEFAQRNATHGVFVDNIGLNGLLILKGGTDREFFITAYPQAEPGVRWFHLKAEKDGGITTLPIKIEVR